MRWFFRVRKLSEMTEKMSQSLLDTVISVTGSMAAPLIRSKQGRAFLASVPGEVVLASLDAISECPAAANLFRKLLSKKKTSLESIMLRLSIWRKNIEDAQNFVDHTCLSVTDKVMDAVEAAEKKSLAATSNVVAGAVSRR
jgi:hypothetical protein